MAGYQDWMNPNPQAAHMDRLLNARAGVMGERNQTRERVEPQWQLPWQGPEGFITDIPGRQQFNPGTEEFGIERTMVPFEDEEYFGAGSGAPAPLPDYPLSRGRESINQEYIGAINPALGGTFGNPGLVAQNEGLTGSGRVKDISTKKWPPSGSSIADSFYRGVTGLSNLVGRGMDQLIPPAY